MRKSFSVGRDGHDRGRRLLIDTDAEPGATTQDLATLQQVADSIRFVP